MKQKKAVIIAGPTAVGKTECAIEIACRFHGEIVSADSMQIYQYMNIGSAKPTAAEQARAVHHLIGVVDPAQPFSAAQYQRMAKAAIADVAARGRLPVISGGTGLYINALIYDMDFSASPCDSQYRSELLRLSQQQGSQALHRMLAQKDPKAAERIHENNEKKLIRALEILHQGQERVREFSESFQPAKDFDYILVGLCRPRQELYDRINRRVDLLMEQGLCEEVQSLLDMGLCAEHISMKGIGYKEIIGYLRGEYSRKQAVELIKKNTRHYAKRQMTWLRRYESMRWFSLSEGIPAAEQSGPIAAFLEGELQR